ncbi:MAG TPA: PAS domain-containing sensor histidine kinase [Acidimicrobiales bacterium]|nr:PAS domain-containing sensor histidine kinase [Acidimicrobiales bacterium]
MKNGKGDEIPSEGTSSKARADGPASVAGDQLDLFLSLMPDAALALDADGAIAVVNGHAAELFGYAQAELVGKRVEVLVPERLRERHRKNRASFVESPLARPMGAGLELFGRRHDGTEFPVDISLAPLWSGDRLFVVAAIRDTSGQKAAVAAQAEVAALVRSSHDAIIGLTLQGAVSSWNPGAERVFGLAPEKITGKHVSALVPDESSQALEALLDAAVNGRDSHPVDTWWTRSDGTSLAVALSVSPISGPDGDVTGFSLFLRDITERKRVESELRRHEQQLALAGDRERIARDLHDLVIQRLFGAGMGLQSAVRFIDNPEASKRVLAAIDDLDVTIKEIRSAIFALETPLGTDTGLRSRLVELTAASAQNLGFEPDVQFVGPVDSGVSEDIEGHVLAVAREALSNIARHADASEARLELSVGEDVVLVVEDNGKGVGPLVRESGIANLRARAVELGGELKVGTLSSGGTRLEWRVPTTP